MEGKKTITIGRKEGITIVTGEVVQAITKEEIIATGEEGRTIRTVSPLTGTMVAATEADSTPIIEAEEGITTTTTIGHTTTTNPTAETTTAGEKILM